MIGPNPRSVLPALLPALASTALTSTALVAVALAWTAAAPLAAQRTWTVDPSGANGFRTIPAALQFARHGDTVIIRAGIYDRFGTTDQGIRILCDPNVVVGGAATAALIVENLPAGQQFVLRDVSMNAGLLAVRFIPITLRNNQGTVHLQDVHLDSVAEGIVVENCRLVSAAGCELGGRLGMLADNSTVSLSDCSVLGDGDGCQPGDSCQGLLAKNSQITVSGGRIWGGLALFSGTPGAGVRLQGGRFKIAGDASTVVRGGTALFGTPAPTPAFDTTGGRLEIDQDVVLDPGHGAPAIQGPATVVQRAFPALIARGVLSGQTMTAKLLAAPGSSGFLLGNLPRPPIPTPFGDLWFGLDGFVVANGTVGMDGTLTFPVPIPNIDPGSVVVLQGVTLQGLTIELSTPAFVVLN